jgi:hypothetical protein
LFFFHFLHPFGESVRLGYFQYSNWLQSGRIAP